MPKPIHFTPHAREACARRGIEEALVRRIVEQPGQRVAAKGYVVLQEKFFDVPLGKSMLLRAIVRESPEETHILTVYKTSRIEKYWRPEGESA